MAISAALAATPSGEPTAEVVAAGRDLEVESPLVMVVRVGQFSICTFMIPAATARLSAA
jgi:hypothetical protein